MLGTAEPDSYVKQRFGIKGYWKQKPPKNTEIWGLLFSGRLTQEVINKTVINNANIIFILDPHYNVNTKQLDGIYVYVAYLERWITGKLGALMLSRAFNLDLKMYREQINMDEMQGRGLETYPVTFQGGSGTDRSELGPDH